MQEAISLLSVVPMRKEPSHRSEMVSQILFGEYVRTGEVADDFVHVTCKGDGYEGWVQASQLTPVAPGEVASTSEFLGVYAGRVLVNSRPRTLPLAAPLYRPQNESGALIFGQQEVRYSISAGDVWNSREKTFSKEALDALYPLYLDTPYLWGGKSVFGIDCSGFVQQVFKLFGVSLLRDASLQAGQGVAVNGLADAKPGDLAFFHNEKGRVTHVGLMLEDYRVVHASGKVRVDSMDRDGILNAETGTRTHHLHSIRRFF